MQAPRKKILLVTNNLPPVRGGSGIVYDNLGRHAGGRIVVLDFGKPANALWRKIYFTHLKCSVPLIGLLFCGRADAYAYILESLKHYPAQFAVAEKMRGLRLADVQIVNFIGGAMAINFGKK